ncbi:hypothetical protein D9M68_796520 [compost metagenome]
MVVMRVTAQDTRHVRCRHITRNERCKDFSTFIRMRCSPCLRLYDCTRQGARNFRLITNQTATQTQHTAGRVDILPIKIGRDFLEAITLALEEGVRIIASHGLHFTLLQGFRKEISRILQPLDFGIRIDTLLGRLNSEEVADGACLIADGNLLAFQISDRIDA